MPDTPSVLAQALQGRYTLERELGRGGMATVYLAHDLKHDRPVALKVLHPNLAATLGPERFHREIRLAARLQHPHILTVLDSGEATGQLWFTMPCVEGGNLRTRLTREGQLPVDAALRITREVAQALQYAHEHGVIHRDIKPENLLLTTDGNTLVADFGIARALGGVGAEERLTETGLSLGTPRYMSPEQASAERALDARTDVYSLGCVLYEMLAGEPPFTGPTAQAILAKRFSEPVPSVRRVRPSVPEAVDLALERALALVPADRFLTAMEFARALELGVTTPTTAPTTIALPPQAERTPIGPAVTKRPSLGFPRRVPLAALALGLGFVVGLGVLFAWRRTHAAGAGHEGGGPKVLAVLPFENLGDSADAYFADGVTDAVRGKLAGVGTLRVIASASAGQYKHSAKPPQQIARELGADYLLVGRIRWEKSHAPSRVEVSPELVDVTEAGSPITRWQQPFDADLSDVFAVQAEIATRVAEALGVALGAQAREQLNARPTQNLAAYDAYLQAVGEGDLIVASPQRHRQMIALLERAVALDSDFAPAWAQLSLAHAYAYHQDALDPADLDVARQAAERAVRLDALLPVARRALGDAARFRGDWPAAIRQYEAGLRVAPNDAELLSSMARASESAGRWDEALVKLRQAERIDPRSVSVLSRQHTSLLVLHRYREALEIAVREQAIAPAALGLRLDQAVAQFGMGDSTAAVATLRGAIGRVTPGELADLGLSWITWAGYLTDAEQRVLMLADPAAFGGDRVRWGLTLAAVAYIRADSGTARAYADSARVALEPRLRRSDDPLLHAFLARTHAFAGLKGPALKESEAVTASMPLSLDAVEWQRLRRWAAGTEMIAGEPEQAITTLESLLTGPSWTSPTILRYDPWWRPLRGNPRFERLLAGK